MICSIAPALRAIITGAHVSSMTTITGIEQLEGEKVMGTSFVVSWFGESGYDRYDDAG